MPGLLGNLSSVFPVALSVINVLYCTIEKKQKKHLYHEYQTKTTKRLQQSTNLMVSCILATCYATFEISCQGYAGKAKNVPYRDDMLLHITVTDQVEMRQLIIIVLG